MAHHHWLNPLGLEKALTFFKSWSTETAYITGLLFADGCITEKNGKAYELNMELKDIEFLEKVALVIDPKIRVHRYERPDGRKSAKFGIGIASVVEDVMALGITPRKSLTCQ